jgi:hypothetical protein
MFAVTHLIGFGVSLGALTSGLEIDRTLGTNIGDAIGGGGLAAAFNGTTSETAASGAQLNASTSFYVGKTGNIPRYISKVTCYGSNNAGYVASADPTITLTLCGKNGSAPANSTDGTVLGSITFTDSANESTGRDIVSTVQDQKFDHWWVAGSAVSSSWRIAELRFYE